MRFRMKRLEPRDVSLQMTSMIDIVFLLVIFFMCTVQISKLEVDPDVVLPVAYSGSPEKGPERLIVNVGRDGALRVMAEKHTLESLERLIAEEAARRAGSDGRSALMVRIRADADAPYQHVSGVLQACRRAGVWKLSFGASTPEPPAGAPAM